MNSLKETFSITPEVIAQHGLTKAEFGNIKKALGRDPNVTELGVFELWCVHADSGNRWKLEFSVRQQD